MERPGFPSCAATSVEIFSLATVRGCKWPFTVLSGLPHAHGMHRHRRRWSRDEDDLLEDLLGRQSTEAIARRMGRTMQAIWARASSLRLSPYSADGRYTASEIARILDVPANTVLLWCGRGYVSAHRVGRRGRGGAWRIEWDATGPLVLVSPRIGSTMRALAARGAVTVVRLSPASRTTAPTSATDIAARYDRRLGGV